MEIIRTYVPDSLANYNHLVYCPTTRQAAAVDPFDAGHLVQLARKHELNITQIWITHEHGDHIRDLSKLKAMTGATVYAPMTCSGLFDADVWLEDEQWVAIGESQLQHLLTPGHTPGHGVFIYQNPNVPTTDFIVCADTLFNAGVGNTRSGNVEHLYNTIKRLNQRLSADTRLFPGHDYLPTNLKFVLHHFPDCQAASETLTRVAQQSPDERSVQRIRDEHQFNPFLSLNADWVVNQPDFTDLTARQRFLELRARRDQW